MPEQNKFRRNLELFLRDCPGVGQFAKFIRTYKFGHEICGDRDAKMSRERFFARNHVFSDFIF